MILDNLFLAFGLTLFAGLSTGIGSAIAFFLKKPNKKVLSFSLGLSAGVMIYVSFMEMMPHAIEAMQVSYDSSKANIIAVACFFAGILLIGLIDKLVPEYENPHEFNGVGDTTKNKDLNNDKLKRVGLFTAFAIAIHNFPEGIATFVSAIESPEIGLAIAIAVAIHNIPEGIAVSVPIYQATENRKKAFTYSFLSGLAEPLGAIIAYIILMPYLSETLMGAIFAIVAGIMVYISLDELLPSAEKFGEHHTSILGVVIGMGVMALSLILL